MKKCEFEEKGGITAEGMVNALKRTGVCTWIAGSSVNESGRTQVRIISDIEVAGFAWKEATNEDTLLITEMQNVKTGYDREEEPKDRPLRVWQEEFVRKISAENEKDFFFVGDQEGRAGKTWLANWLERNMGARVIPFIIDPLEIVSYAYHYPGQIYVMDLTRTQSIDEPEVFGALEAIANGRLMTRTAEGMLKTAVRRPSKIVIMSNNNTIPRSISKERLSAYILPAERGIEREII